EPPGQDQAVDRGEAFVPVPDRQALRPQEPHGPKGVPVVQRAGERDHADPGLRGHGVPPVGPAASDGPAGSNDRSPAGATATIRWSSMTGLDRNRSLMADTGATASASVSAWMVSVMYFPT